MKDVHAEPNPGTVVEKETGTLSFFFLLFLAGCKDSCGGVRCVFT